MSFFGMPLRNGLPIGLGSGAGFGVPAFDPQQLFSNGEQGAWYDPSDFSTLFQDAAGTVPVTAAGQSVRLMRDKSGRGNNATAPSDAARPVLQVDASGLWHLTFNGTSQSMSTGSINFTASNKMSVFAGVRKLSDAVNAVIAELSTTVFGNNGSFWLVSPDPSLGGTVQFRAGGTSKDNLVRTGFAAPVSMVLTGLSDISAPRLDLRINGAQTTSTATQGTGNYGNYPLYIGARNNSSLFFNGRLYGLIARGAQSSTAEISNTESWMNVKTGAY